MPLELNFERQQIVQPFLRKCQSCQSVLTADQAAAEKTSENAAFMEQTSLINLNWLVFSQ